MKVEVKDYEGFYSIDKGGCVYSLPRNGTIKATRKLKPSTDGNYFGVVLQKNGVKKRFLLHRLIATSFIPNPQNKPCVNHIDGNKTNNDLSNLEWVTYSENCIHAIENNLYKHNKYCGKMNQDKANEVRKMHIEGKSQKEIATLFNVDASNVSRIINNKTWAV